MRSPRSEAFALLVLEHFQSDPVISLERPFPPTHALVRSVYAADAMRALVEIELIDQPPPPSGVTFGGSFFESTFERMQDDEREHAWFCFDATLPMDANVARLRAHVRDSIALFGARGAPPSCRDEIELGARGADRKALVRKRSARRAPPPPEPPLPPGFHRTESSPPSSPPSAPPPLPVRAKGSDRGRPGAASKPPPIEPPLGETHTPRPQRAPSSIPPPEPPPPAPLAQRPSYRPPPPPDSLPTTILRRRSNQPPPEPPPPPPIKRD